MFALSEDKNTYPRRGAEKNPAPKVQFFTGTPMPGQHPQVGQPACSGTGGGNVAVQWKVFLQMTFLMKTTLKKNNL